MKKGIERIPKIRGLGGGRGKTNSLKELLIREASSTPVGTDTVPPNHIAPNQHLLERDLQQLIGTPGPTILDLSSDGFDLF